MARWEQKETYLTHRVKLSLEACLRYLLKCSFTAYVHFCGTFGLQILVCVAAGEKGTDVNFLSYAPK